MIGHKFGEFLFPHRTVSAPGASRQVGSQLASAHVQPGTVFIVADRIVHDRGLTVGLLEGLHLAGYEGVVFADVAGEPDVDAVESAVHDARTTAAVAVVGIGGGSALDIAKVVAYGLATNAPVTNLRGPLPEVTGFPPLILIPTTVGTGAEATRVAMFSVAGAKRIVTCPQFVPDLAVLDYELVQDLPPAVIAATAMDALSHCVESMMSTNAHDLTWLLGASAARRIYARLPDAYNGTDPEAVGELLYASFLAGVALNAGVVLGHSLSYVLASRHHLAHGTGCALALPYALAYNRNMDPSIANNIVSEVLGKPGTLLDLAVALENLNRSLNQPTSLAELGGAAADVAALSNTVVTDYPRPTNPVPLEESRIAMLLNSMQSGDLQGAWDNMEAHQ